MSSENRQKLVAYIASERRLSLINTALKYIDSNVQDKYVGKSETITLKPILNKLGMMVIDVIIIDLIAILDEDQLIKSLQSYKAKHEDTQIVMLLASIHKIGTTIPKRLVDLAYYDLIVYDDVENEEANLIQLLQTKNKYANAMKWQKFNDEPAALSADGQTKNSNHPQTIYKHVFNSKIMIANFTKSAGSSFLTLNLARLIDQSGIDVSVVEAPISPPYIYQALNFDEKLRIGSDTDDYISSFISYPHDIAELKPGSIIDLNDKYNKDGNITYYITSPHENDISKVWNEHNMIALLNLATSDTITIVDAGEHFLDERYTLMLPAMDKIYILVEPMVANCLIAKEKLKKVLEMKEKGYKVEFVYNKVTDMSDTAQFMKFTGDKSRGFFKNLVDGSIKVPYLTPKSVQSSHNKGSYALNNPEINYELHNALYGLAQQFVPKQLFKRVNKKLDYIEDGKNAVGQLIGKVKEFIDNV